MRAIQNDNESQVRKLIENGVEFNVYLEFESQVPLLTAINWNRHKILRILLEAGADR